MSDCQVTIVIVPRERFSHSERTLASVYRETTIPFELIYVSAGTPQPIYRRLASEAGLKGFQLIHTDSYLSPNQARNLGMRKVRTKYVVFLDNDALVTRGWLEALVQCAEDTGAWVVGPLYLFGEIERQKIHMAGGILRFTEQHGQRVLYDEQHLFDTPMASVNVPLERKLWDYVEFHCMLVRTDVFERIGQFDEELLSHQEHIDFCLEVQNSGGTVYIEPKAVTTYVPPPPCDWRDLPYFMLRWSEAWNLRTVHHFNEKWNVSTVQFFTDKAEPETDHTTSRWARGHRRLMTGLSILQNEMKDFCSFLDHAQLMVALFMSVDRDRFDLMLMSDSGQVLVSEAALDPDHVFEKLPTYLQMADKANLDLLIRPLTNGRPGEPLLVLLDDLDSSAIEAIRSHAFLILQTKLERYQCWIAVDASNWRSAATLRRLLAEESSTRSSSHYARLAGTKNVGASYGDAKKSYPRISLAEAVIGHLATVRQLENSKIASYLRSGRVV